MKPKRKLIDMAEPHLKRELGLLRVTMMGIGGTLCASSFVIIGYAAGLVGYAIVPVVIVCGVISLLTMLSYAELGTAIPLAGGEYTWAKIAYGGFIGFLTGWFEWLSNMFYAAISAIGFGYVISYLVPQINIPLVAAVVVLVFAFVNLRGVKQTGTIQTVITIVLLIILIMFILGGFSQIQPPQPTQATGSIGLIGIFVAIAYLFELFLGGEAIAAAQAETKNPGRNIPLAIVLTAIITIIIYATVVFVAVGVVPPEILSQQSSPIAFAAAQAMGPSAGVLVTIGLAIAGLATTNETIMAQSRVLYAMSRDGYMPKKLCLIDERFCTPHVAVIVGSIITALFAATGMVNFVVYAVNLGFIIGFSVVNMSLIKLRKIAPHLKRPFRVPLYPLTPIAGLITCVFLTLFIEPSVIVVGIELAIVAVLIYYVRMVGQTRLRIAFGGVSFGLGSFAALVAHLIRTKSIVLEGVSQDVSIVVFYVLVFISIIEFLAGILSVTASDV
jgi:basic amino acid/polyamine antiporter, APA family